MTAALPVLGGLLIAALGDLTVPSDRLPQGCALSPSASVRESANRVRGGLWAGLPIRSNPSTSSEPSVIAAIRVRITGPLVTRDPPALSEHGLARFQLQLADGIDEAYAAVYLEFETQELVTLYGLRFAEASAADEFWNNTAARTRKSPRVTGVLLGPIVAFGIGSPDNACLTAVASHLTSLQQ